MEDFDQFWDYVRFHGPLFAIKITAETSAITQLILDYRAQESIIATGNGWHGEKKYALLAMNEYDTDTQLLLRYHGNNIYDLHFAYYDNDKEDFISVTQVFSST